MPTDDCDNAGWFYIPFLRVALGADRFGGMTEFTSGSRWQRWMLRYRYNLIERGITIDDVKFDTLGAIDVSQQNDLMNFEGEQTKEMQGIAAEIQDWISYLSETYDFNEQTNSAMHDSFSLGSPNLSQVQPPALTPPNNHPTISGQPNAIRLTATQLAEHPPLWRYIPSGCQARFVEAARPYFQAYLTARQEQHDCGPAIDAILAIPSLMLVKKRGGRKGIARINARLSAISRCTRECAAMGLPPPAALGHTPTSPTTAQQTELDKWKAKVRQAIALSKRQHHRRAVKQLLSTGVAEPTAENIDKLDALNTTDSSAVPPCPSDAPLLTIIDPDDLITLIRKRGSGGAGGCSGWTPEILAVLVEDHICFQGILMLIQDIANGDIDHHSRDLLCASLLYGISKPTHKICDPLLSEKNS